MGNPQAQASPFPVSPESALSLLWLSRRRFSGGSTASSGLRVASHSPQATYRTTDHRPPYVRIFFSPRFFVGGHFVFVQGRRRFLRDWVSVGANHFLFWLGSHGGSEAYKGG